MTQPKDTSLVKEFQKVLLDDKDFLKNLLAESLQSILQDEFNRFIVSFQKLSDKNFDFIKRYFPIN